MVNLRIKDICAQKGITQKSLSEMIEVSTTSLSRIITGEQKPSLDTLEKVATALNKKINKMKNARLLLTSNRAQLFDYTKIWIILNTSYFRCH